MNLESLKYVMQKTNVVEDYLNENKMYVLFFNKRIGIMENKMNVS